MKIFRVVSTRAVTDFGSRELTVGGVARCGGVTQVASLRLGPGGLVAEHEAVGPQLFLVVAGDGWVRSDADRVPIRTGEAVFWEDGERHETGSRGGLTAIVVEAESIELV